MSKPEISRPAVNIKTADHDMVSSTKTGKIVDEVRAAPEAEAHEVKSETDASKSIESEKKEQKFGQRGDDEDKKKGGSFLDKLKEDENMQALLIALLLFMLTGSPTLAACAFIATKAISNNFKSSSKEESRSSRNHETPTKQEEQKYGKSQSRELSATSKAVTKSQVFDSVASVRSDAYVVPAKDVHVSAHKLSAKSESTLVR